MLSGSMSTPMGGQAPRCPTRKRRRRLWATPKNCASSTRHARPYPSLSISDRSCRKASPFSLESAPGTFSQRNHRGRISRTARMYSNMSPDSPCNPSRLPAIEKDWHGLPPTTRSTLPRYFFQFILVTSPTFGTSGYRSAKTALGNSSNSAKHTGSQPSGSHAAVAASMPLKSETYFIGAPPMLARRA